MKVQFSNINDCTARLVELARMPELLTDAILEESYLMAIAFADRDPDTLESWMAFADVRPEETAFGAAWNAAHEAMHARAALKAEIDEAIADQGPGYISAEDGEDRLQSVAAHIVQVFSGRASMEEAIAIAREWRDEARNYTG